MKDKRSISVVMLGASGAVGSQVLKTLLKQESIHQITILGRTPIQNVHSDVIHIEQHKVDIFDVHSYRSFLPEHNVSICTLGVGEPSKISKEEFVKIDKTAVIAFAKACKDSGVKHFELLASVAINPKSKSFYLRIKGELVEELKAMNFERLSIFQPSMILTPSNRYGLSQAITLRVWPLLKPLLIGGFRKYRGVLVEVLGRAMALNILSEKSGIEILHWDEFNSIAN